MYNTGKYYYINAASAAGPGDTPYRDGSYEYYTSEPERDDDLKAIDPFIQGCIEMEMLKKNNMFSFSSCKNRPLQTIINSQRTKKRISN